MWSLLSGAGGLTVVCCSHRRTYFDWRPEPLLCKRFKVADPYKGKPPPPPILQQLTNLSRADMLALPDTAAQLAAAQARAAEAAAREWESSVASASAAGGGGSGVEPAGEERARGEGLTP